MVEAVVRRSFVNYTQRRSSVGVTEKKVFLEISQNSQANNCARASILIKFKKKIDSGIGAFLLILQNFQGQHFFNRRLPVAASGMYMYRGLKTYIFIWSRC